MATQKLYDYSFALPINLDLLQSSRLKLVPFDTDLPRFSTLYTTTTNQPAAQSNFLYLPYGPFPTTQSFVEWYTPTIQAAPNVIWFAILVGGADEDFAGTIAYLNTEVGNASSEIGHINILPQYQRTFVTTNAVGLLLHHALDTPTHTPTPSPSPSPTTTTTTTTTSSSPPPTTPWALRRMQWFANASNANSRRAAERLGFVFEGVLRWHRILPYTKVGRGDEPDDGRGKARDSALLSLCWDEWHAGKREVVDALMAR